MQFSKGDKLDTQTHIIKKLEKLKQEVSYAEDYGKLEKCASKLQKIKERVELQTQKKIRKELRKLTDVCEGLIKQKTKYFKKKVLQQLNVEVAKEKSQQKQRSLKYCKSVDTFPINNINVSKRKVVKNQEQQFWGDRTEVQVRSRPRLQELVQSLKEQVQSYKRRINLLQSTANCLPQKLSDKQITFEHQMGLKLKQKALQIEQLKGKLKYHQQINQQLRNRLLNEQKRQQDYIDSLKMHIIKLNQELQLTLKDNKKLQDDLYRQIQLSNNLKNELQRLVEVSEGLQRQKRHRQQSEVLKMKDSGIRRQLETLSQQERYIRQMENALSIQKEECISKKEELARLTKKLTSQQDEISNFDKEKERLSELLQIKGEQIAELKKELASLVEDNKRKEQDLMFTRQELRQYEILIEKERQRKSLEMIKKVQYLKRVKQLLN